LKQPLPVRDLFGRARAICAGAMSAFNTQALVEKLSRLNSSQQSIETISAWCTFYRKVRRFGDRHWLMRLAPASRPTPGLPGAAWGGRWGMPR